MGPGKCKERVCIDGSKYIWQFSCTNCHIGKMPYTFWLWQFSPMGIFLGIDQPQKCKGIGKVGKLDFGNLTEVRSGYETWWNKDIWGLGYSPTCELIKDLIRYQIQDLIPDWCTDLRCPESKLTNLWCSDFWCSRYDFQAFSWNISSITLLAP